MTKIVPLICESIHAKLSELQIILIHTNLFLISGKKHLIAIQNQ